jgi:hypothetical protein
MNIERPYCVFPDARIGALGTICREFRSAKNFSMTSSIACRRSGSTSGVMIVANCSDPAATPGTRAGYKVFR